MNSRATQRNQKITGHTPEQVERYTSGGFNLMAFFRKHSPPLVPMGVAVPVALLAQPKTQEVRQMAPASVPGMEYLKAWKAEFSKLKPISEVTAFGYTYKSFSGQRIGVYKNGEMVGFYQLNPTRDYSSVYVVTTNPDGNVVEGAPSARNSKTGKIHDSSAVTLSVPIPNGMAFFSEYSIMINVFCPGTNQNISVTFTDKDKSKSANPGSAGNVITRIVETGEKDFGRSVMIAAKGCSSVYFVSLETGESGTMLLSDQDLKKHMSKEELQSIGSPLVSLR